MSFITDYTHSVRHHPATLTNSTLWVSSQTIHTLLDIIQLHATTARYEFHHRLYILCYTSHKNKQLYSLSLSVLTAIFPGEPGLAGVIVAKDDASGGDSWSYKSCKAPVKSSPPTNQHPTILQARCPSCRPTNSVKALKGNEQLH